MTQKIFEQHSYFIGRCLGSKMGYMNSNPNHDVYFNGNISTIDDGKIWWGDIDLTEDRELLGNIARELGQDLYILREMDGRFENEGLSGEEYAKKAVAVIYCI